MEGFSRVPSDLDEGCTIEVGRRVLGRGSYGTVYDGRFNGEDVAVKVELKHVVSGHRFKPLEREWEVMQRLGGLPGVVVGLTFEESATASAIAMPLCGPSLGDLKRMLPGRKIPRVHMLVIARQMIQLLQLVHSRGVAHRDVKPDNFLVNADFRAPGAPLTLHLIDFGLSKTYRDGDESHEHIPCTTKEYTRGVSGTPRYCSLNSHLYNEQSRRDDLEACGYSILWLLRGSVPWQGIKMPTKWLKLKAIFERKRIVNIEKVCKTQLPELAVHILYCRELEFEEEPDYEYLCELYERAFERERPGADIAAARLEWPRQGWRERVNVRLHELLFGKLARRDNSELEDLFPYIDFVNEPGSPRTSKERLRGGSCPVSLISWVRRILLCAKRASSPPPEQVSWDAEKSPPREVASLSSRKVTAPPWRNDEEEGILGASV
jgi:serine/threonine protein kinase